MSDMIAITTSCDLGGAANAQVPLLGTTTRPQPSRRRTISSGAKASRAAPIKAMNSSQPNIREGHGKDLTKPIYTTNAIDSLHSGVRKSIRNKGHSRAMRPPPSSSGQRCAKSRRSGRIHPSPGRKQGTIRNPVWRAIQVGRLIN